MWKRVLLKIMTFVKNPLKSIPLNLEFPVIPIFMSHLIFKIPYYFFCDSLLWLCHLIERGLARSFLMYHSLPTSIKNSCLLIFVIIRLCKGNWDFLKDLINLFKIYCCLTLILSLEQFKLTINEVKC